MGRASTIVVRMGGLLLLAGAFAAPPAAANASAASGWLGVMIDGPVVLDGDAGGQVGVRLGRVFEDSPAAAAGLRARDVVLEVGGQPVAGSRELAQAIREHGARAWVPVTIDRAGHRRDLRVRLGVRPDDTSPKRLRRGRVGVDAIDLPSTLREHFGSTPDSGVMIAAIAAGSPAQDAGLELGDVVVDVDGDPVRGVGALRRLIQGAGVGNVVELTVMRDGVEIVLETIVEHDDGGDATR